MRISGEAPRRRPILFLGTKAKAKDGILAASNRDHGPH
jgi:hypothetical protein